MTTAPAKPTTFAEAEAVLAKALPGYESRPQQQRLAAAVEDALADGFSLLAEAGCGTGKSLGVAIPAILAGKRVVYSTATIALQEQVANKDMPFLQEHLGVPFAFALLKGRSNYWCKAKANEADRRRFEWVESAEAELLAGGEEHLGSKEDFATPIPANEWLNVAATADECPGKSECPFGKVCYSEAAKARARAADVVIVNHALTFTDLKIREKTEGMVTMLGEYDAIILDEAHEVEEIATNSLGESLLKGSFDRLVADVQSFAAKQGHARSAEIGNDVLTAATLAWDSLPTEATEKTEYGRMMLRWFEQRFDVWSDLVDALKRTSSEVASIVAYDERSEARRAVLGSRIHSLVEKLFEALTEEDSRLVRWVEVDEHPRFGRRVALKTAPLNVTDWLTEWLWSKTTAILVSATMSAGGSFDYIKSRIGLADAETLIVGTPFDYGTQAMLYVPGNDMASPKSQQAWRVQAQVRMMDLIEASQGGALLLFTSRTAMKEAHEALAERLEARGLTVLMQGANGTNKEISRVFAEDTHSVLFALKSFMTGVDFAGETCRLVVIDKLPFSVPSDVMFNARCQEVNRQAGRQVDFGQMTIPAMTLTLNQAFGRLIRSKSDRGVVAILDNRLTQTGYGKGILRSLPDSPCSTDMAPVRAFFGR